MLNYAVVEIKGRQYKVQPDTEFLVDFMGSQTSLSCDKVMMISDGDKLDIGTPYLSKTLDFEVLGEVKGKKIRVAKYHSKSNTRRVVGSRKKSTKLKMIVK